MADIFDKLTTQKQDAPKRDIFDSILVQQKGGGITDETETSQDSDAGRGSNEQVQPQDKSGGLQTRQQRVQGERKEPVRSLDSSNGESQQASDQVSQSDIFDQLVSKGGERIEKGKQTNVQAKDGGKGQKDGQGLRFQSNAGNEAEITDERGGVQSPTQNYLQRLVSSAKESPTEALTAAGASAAESGIALGVGSVAGKAAGSIAGKLLGSVAAAAAVPLAAGETAATGGLGALAVPAIEMGAFAAGSYLGDKATQLVEKMIGADKAIEQAKEANPELSQVASIATMAPMAVGSIKNLVKMGAKEAGKKIVGGAIGGAAFEPVRYGVESILKTATGSDQDVSPITLGSEAESALMGAVLSAHGARQIEETIGPATARAAVETETNPAIEEKQKARQAEIEASVAELTKGTEYATETGKEQKGNISKYPYGNEAWQATETGYSHSLEPSEEGQEEIKGNRIYAAAYRDPETGVVHTGKDHETAETKAGKEPETNPDKRNTPNHGFVTELGEFISREDAERIARANDQYKGNISGQPVMHSTDTALDIEKEKAAEPAPETEAPQTAEKPRPLAGAAAVGEFEKNNVVEASRLLRDSSTTFDRNNPQDFERFKQEYTVNFDEGTFEGEQGEATLKQIYDKAHDAFEIHANSNGKIPIEKAVEQVGVKENAVKELAATNANVNADRVARGLEPIHPEKQLTNDQSWNEAARRIQDSPTYQADLLERVRANKMAVVDQVDMVALLQHKGDLINERERLETKIRDEKDPEKLKALELSHSKLEDDIGLVETAYNRVGSTSAAALQIRQIQRNTDHSYASIKSKREKSLKRPLTKEEENRAKQQSRELREIDRKADELQKQKKTKENEANVDLFIDEAISDAKQEKAKKPFEPVKINIAPETPEAKAAYEDRIKQLEAELEARPKYGKEVFEQARKIVDEWKADAADAEKLLSKQLSQLGSFPDVSIVATVARILRAYIGEFGLDFAEASTRMVEKYGPQIEPFLKEAWEKAKELISSAKVNPKVRSQINDTAKAKSEIRTKAEPRKKVGEMTSDELVDRYSAKLGENKENPMTLGSTIRSIAKALIQKDVDAGKKTNRSELLQNVTAIASKELGKDWDVQKTIDAVAGNGIFKQISKTETQQRLSDWTGLVNKLSQVGDVLAGAPPRRLAPERRKQQVEERLVGKKINALIKQLGIVVKDPETQLNGALDAIRNRFKNEIAELNVRIKTGERKAAKEKLPYPPDILELKAQRDALQKEFDSIHGKPEASMEQKIASAEKMYDRQIQDLQSQINRGEIYRVTKEGQKVTSQKIEAQKAQLESLRAERKAMQDADSIRKEYTTQQALVKKIQAAQDKLAGITKEKKGAISTADSAETAKLRKEYEGLLEQLKKPKKTEEEKTIESLNDQIATLNDKISREDYSTNPKKYTADSKQVSDLKDTRDALQKKVKEGRAALEPKKTYDERIEESLIKSIEDLEDKIQKGDIEPRINKRQGADPKKIAELKERKAIAVKKLQKLRNEAKVKKTEEEKKVSSLEKRAEEIKKQLAAKDLLKKPKKAPLTGPEIEKAQKELDDLISQRKDEVWFQTAKEQSALQAYKSRTLKQIAEFQRILDERDFTKKERKPTPVDDELLALKREAQKKRDEISQENTLIEWQNRTKAEKALDAAVKWKRAAVLAYLGTLTKLTASSFAIPLVRIPAEIAGAGLRRIPIIRDIAALSRQQARGNVGKDIKIYSKGLYDGVKEFKNIAFKLGRSQLDLEYGNGSKIPLGPLDFFGKVHEAFKNPTKLANFKLAFERYMDWAARTAKTNGEKFDYNDPVLQQKAAIEAFKEANRSIFMQDNKIVKQFNLFVSNLRKSENLGTKIVGAALQEFLPIVKIPTNIVAEVFEYQFGAFTGASKVIKAMKNGLEKLSPEEADVIMRQLKKGSVGLAAMAIGAALPDVFGGFYRKGVDKDEEAPDYGGIIIGGQKIGKNFLHNPAFVAFQIGATVRKIWDDSIDESSEFGDKASTFAGAAVEAQLGILEELPFVSFSRNVGQYFDPNKKGANIGGIVKSNIPGFVQEFAQATDIPDGTPLDGLISLLGYKDKVTKRVADDFTSQIESGLPVFRQQLEEK